MRKKVCKTCKKEKPFSEFRRSNHTVDKRTKSCSACIDKKKGLNPEEDRIFKQQAAMLQALESSAGNVSKACKAIKISRQTHYDWLDKYDNYKKGVEEITEALIDFGETALLKNMKKGDTTAIIFFLKTKGKNRGYVERVETEDVSDPWTLLAKRSKERINGGND